MQKIISLFQRNYDGDRLVKNEVVPGAEWVLAGEGVATRKYDGTCCLIRGGKLFKRHEVKKGGKAPVNFEPANGVDEATGKQQGWIPVGDGPEDQYHREGLASYAADFIKLETGTYELVGPKIQGNPEGLHFHTLVPHAYATKIKDVPREFDALKVAMQNFPHEGIVWHHPDGRMVKIKRKDFYKK